MCAPPFSGFYLGLFLIIWVRLTRFLPVCPRPILLDGSNFYWIIWVRVMFAPPLILKLSESAGFLEIWERTLTWLLCLILAATSTCLPDFPLIGVSYVPLKASSSTMLYSLFLPCLRFDVDRFLSSSLMYLVV
jgi:hypothetical protein